MNKRLNSVALFVVMFAFYSSITRAMAANPPKTTTNVAHQANNNATVIPANVKRLPELLGFDGRKNDVIFAGPMNDGVAAVGGQGHVMYFHGDIQNYPEQMEKHTTNKHWNKWNLDSTAELLRRRFPYSYIWVVRASRLHLNTFACFDNFVTGDTFGGPEFSPDRGALRHLQALLDSAISQTFSCAGTSSFHESSPSSPDQCDREEADLLKTLPVTLIGFSKGCVVPNQILHELESTRSDPISVEMVKQITDIYWLDGGHSRQDVEAYVTDRETLRNLGDTLIRVHVHLSPFQARNPDKPRLGKQARKFVTILRSAGVDVSDSVHFDDEAPSLENHFRILEMF